MALRFAERKLVVYRVALRNDTLDWRLSYPDRLQRKGMCYTPSTNLLDMTPPWRSVIHLNIVVCYTKDSSQLKNKVDMYVCIVYMIVVGRIRRCVANDQHLA